MDGIKVTALDRLKNRFKMWVRDALYELPTAVHLKQGREPGMVVTLNQFFADREAGMYLPYEVFTDDGLFKNEESFGFGLELYGLDRKSWQAATALQGALLEQLPEELFIQLQVFAIGAGMGRFTTVSQGFASEYRCWLTVTGPQTDATRSQLREVRQRVRGALERHGLIVAEIQPEDLIQLLSSMLDAEVHPHYDDERLVKTQVGVSKVAVRNGRLALSHQGAPVRDLIIYQARRFGVVEPQWIRHVYDTVIGRGEFFFTLNFRRSADVVEGQFLVMEPVAAGQAGQLETLLLQNEWLIELDRYCTHLSWLSLQPFGVGPMVFGGIEAQRRWNPITTEKLTKILPLPYVQNLVEVPAGSGPSNSGLYNPTVAAVGAEVVNG